jgi:hypothetical protein
LAARPIGPRALCLGILSLDARFAEVKPRRPKGGPDEAHDIERVKDDSKDKQKIKQKFKDDVDKALKKNPTLRGFIFFTNVDLSLKDQAELLQYGRLKGLSFVELYHRERLRMALDDARGLHLRYQYLSLDLSPAEQQAFFAEYGQALERLVQGGFRAVEKRLRWQEFLLEYQRQLVWAAVVVTLDRPANAEELGHF